jgi:sorbitol-specific phosphotransferase system component IIC
MLKQLHSYRAYSICCFIVWGIIFLLGITLHAYHVKNHAVVYVFIGWVIGWLSATIARKVYK